MIKTTKLAALAAATLLGACQQAASGGSGNVTAQTEDQKTFYALGALIGRNLKSAQLKPEDLDFVKQGLTDQALGKTLQVDLASYGPKVQQMMMAKQRASMKQESAADATAATDRKAKDKPFEEAAAKEPGAQVLPSGLVFRTVTPGKGETPKATDVVKVNYEGKLSDGTVFDSSYKRGQPATFPLHGVIPCWTEGVQKMKVGETARLVCPSSIAYGDRGHPPTIPGGATLDFKVELLSIEPGGAAGMGMGGHPSLPPGHPAVH